MGSKVSVYENENLRIFVSRDGGLWHLSISHPSRYPTYDEIKEARYELLPDNITVGLLFPPKKEFVNIHENCFHLWEIPEK